MIKKITDKKLVLDFAQSFFQDPHFSDPMLSNEKQIRNNLLKPIDEHGKYRIIGVYREDSLIGLFIFLIIPDEKYAEMIVGLSRTADAYDEIMEYLKANYHNFHCDFVYNPRNYLLHNLLKKLGATFYTEQVKMVLKKSVPIQISKNIVAYDSKYWFDYEKLHDDGERYWSAQRIIASQDKFRVFVALHNNEVIGYIDVTHCFDENEPYDLYVRDDMRHMGYGRELLAMAIKENFPNDMMVLIDQDNIAALHLYESVGFIKDELGGNITAYMTL